MTQYFVGPGGSDGNAGTSWAQRKLTLGGAEALSPAGGDVVYVGPGTYRELLTCSVSGGNQYTTGTVSVTNGSAVISGSGTSWLANAFADGQFRVTNLASGADGVANGTTTFTSAAGNFQAGHVGCAIQIGTKGAFTITAVGSATSITLSGSPAAGSGLSYSVMSPEPAEILSVDSNTQITLKQAWTFPSFTGLAYETYRDIKYIADLDGTHTDGVGGIVRITGSDNDTTNTRATCIAINTRNYRTFRGFVMDFCSSSLVTGQSADVIIEDCTFQDSVNAGITVTTATQLRWTVRRNKLLRLGSVNVTFTHTATLNDANHLVINCIMSSRSNGVNSTRVGGITVQNNTFDASGNTAAINIATALAVGQAMMAYNNIITACSTGIQATIATEFIEDYNNIFNCSTARTNVTAGSNSQAYAVLFKPPLLVRGSVFILIDYSLSAQSPLGSIAGFNPPYSDAYGTPRSNPSSWGAVQYEATRRPSDAGLSRGRAA